MEERMRTIAQEKAYAALMLELQELEILVRQMKLKDALIPPEWREIEAKVPVQPKRTKVTVDLDADVVRWFRAMGLGYQRRMNAVLRTFMLALASKEILSRGDKDWKHDEIWGKAAPKKKE